MDVDNINVVLVVVASAITDNILVSSVNVANIESGGCSPSPLLPSSTPLSQNSSRSAGHHGQRHLPSPAGTHEPSPAASSGTGNSSAIRPDSVLDPIVAYLICPVRPSFGPRRL